MAVKVSSLIFLSLAVAQVGFTRAQTTSSLPPAVSGRACVAAGAWKGTMKTPVLSSVNGHVRMYGWLEWDRPGRWTGRRCEANWWVFTSQDGSKFRPVFARTDFLNEGEQPSLAVSEFSPTANWAAADAMTTFDGKTRHGYFVANLGERTSCFGSAVKALDGVRAELTMSREPFFQQLLGVDDTGWLQLSIHARLTSGETEDGIAHSGRKSMFEPCSGKFRIDKPK